MEHIENLLENADKSTHEALKDIENATPPSIVNNNTNSIVIGEKTWEHIKDILSSREGIDDDIKEIIQNQKTIIESLEKIIKEKDKEIETYKDLLKEGLKKNK